MRVALEGSVFYKDTVTTTQHLQFHLFTCPSICIRSKQSARKVLYCNTRMAHVHGPNCAHGAEQPPVELTPEQQQLLAQQQQEMTDLRSEPYKKIALELAQFLRHNATLKNKSGVLDGKRVEYFKGIATSMHQEYSLII